MLCRARLALFAPGRGFSTSVGRFAVDPIPADGEGWDVRRRRLKVRSWQRGWKENAMMMGSFADRNLVGLTEQELDQFDQLMTEGDNDLFSWITKQKEVPVKYQNNLMSKLQAHVVKYQFNPTLGK